MASKKVPISISPEWLQEINALAALMGMDPTVYGYIPKTLRFGITIALASIESMEKGIPDLETDEMKQLLSSISKAKSARLMRETAAKAAADAQKVYPATPGKYS